MLLRYQSVVGSAPVGPCHTTSVSGGAAGGISLSSLASPGVRRRGQGQHASTKPQVQAAQLQ
eukprot:9100309-Pyramimonas_sp.AAC.1